MSTETAPNLSGALTALEWVGDTLPDAWDRTITDKAADLRRRLRAVQAGEKVDADALADAIAAAMALQETVDAVDGVLDNIDTALESLGD